MRRYDKPAQAETEPGEAGNVRPLKFHAWGRTYVVTEVLHYWSEDRQWWKPGASADPRLREDRSQVTQCLELLRHGHPIDADRLAWLGVLLTSHAVRDLAGAVAARYGQDLAALLWMECARRLQPDYVSGAVFNLAVEAAAADQVVLARAAADRVLAIHPHCSCARALLCLLDIGARPQSIREAFDPATCESVLRAAELRLYSARPVLPLSRRARPDHPHLFLARCLALSGGPSTKIPGHVRPPCPYVHRRITMQLGTDAPSAWVVREHR